MTNGFDFQVVCHTWHSDVLFCFLSVRHFPKQLGMLSVSVKGKPCLRSCSDLKLLLRETWYVDSWRKCCIGRHILVLFCPHLLVLWKRWRNWIVIDLKGIEACICRCKDIFLLYWCNHILTKNVLTIREHCWLNQFFFFFGSTTVVGQGLPVPLVGLAFSD